MKTICIVAQVVILVACPASAFSQMWKQYADSAKALGDQKNFDGAISFYDKAKEELKKDSMGTISYAKISTSLANLYRDKSDFKKAEAAYLEANEIWEKTLGKESTDYALTCNALGRLYFLMEKYSKADSLFQKSKSIIEKVEGKENMNYAKSCNSLANLYSTISQYKKAEPLYLEAMGTIERVQGKENRDYIVGSFGLAALYTKMGQFLKAETLHLQAKAIIEKVEGKGNPDYASSCNSLAVLYISMGKYEPGERLLLEAKEIREKILGKNHPDYAASCNNLAILYMYMAQTEKAEALYLESKTINEKAFGKANYGYASNCNNLALLYVHMGQFAKAEPLYLEAKQIKEQLVGKESADYAFACNNLADLYAITGKYDSAEPLYLEAKQIREKLLGEMHPDYAVTCLDLADLYRAVGKYEQAESLYLEAKQIWEKTVGKLHPDYALDCYQLGKLYVLMGKYDQAEALFLESRQIRQEDVGRDHPDYAASCMDLANLYSWEKKFDKANNLYAEVLRSIDVQIKRTFRFTSESEKLSYLTTIKDYNNYFLSFNMSDYSIRTGGFGYDVSLSSRNLVLSSSQQLRQSIYDRPDTVLKTRYHEWIEMRQQLSFWYSKPIAKRPDYLKNLDEQANALEKELTRVSSAFRMQQSQNEVTWQMIQQNLGPNETAIEFANFAFFDGRRYTDSSYYIALLLRKDRPQPVLIYLFEKKRLDSLLNNADNNNPDLLYSESNSLYALIWKPLEKYLKGISKIYFAPAGDLFKISFAALPIDEKNVLSDKYRLIQLNTTATLTDKKESFVTSSDKILLYGGIDYSGDTSALKQVALSYHAADAAPSYLPQDLKRSGNIQYLPGSQEEVQQIKQQAKKASASVTVFSGINATEESFKALSGSSSPSVLHIATHGFFFPDPKTNKRDSIQHLFENSGKVFKQSDDPLFRSGLLFAGANNTWQGKAVNGIDDGIVTAYDVSNMYLPNTKLVVLSACETALGDIQGSEGVYGLQRAFKIAGVPNLVMSLWKVPDAETAEFMQLFYQNMFNKKSIDDAFHYAQSVMKSKYRNEPYKWGAWILIK